MHIKEMAIKEIYSKMIKPTLWTSITMASILMTHMRKEQLGKISKSMVEQLITSSSKRSWS